MINNVKNNFFSELNKMIIDIKGDIDFLESEDRKDEANLERVKLNVLDIFKQMFDVSYRNVFNSRNKNDEAVKLSEFKNTYNEFYTNIPRNWYASLENAKKNNDFEKIAIEELKIETMEKIKNCFENCLEV
jgi:hypothetical protein